jgi:hypothetical protein
MSLNSPAVPAAVLLPLALGAVALVQIRGPRRWIMTRALAMAHADQRKLDVSIDEWHEYGLRWAGGAAAFDLDGETILTTHRPASGPLGFVAWIDNQYAVASPEKGLRFGVIPTDREQWLEIEGLHLEAG